MTRPLDYVAGNYLVGIVLYLGVVAIVVAEAYAIFTGKQPPFVVAALFAVPLRKLRPLIERLRAPAPVRRLWLGLCIWWAEERQLDAENDIAFFKAKAAEATGFVSHYAQRAAALRDELRRVV